MTVGDELRLTWGHSWRGDHATLMRRFMDAGYVSKEEHPKGPIYRLTEAGKRIVDDENEKA